MPVTFVAAGAVQNVYGTTESLPTPAGLAGDLVLFLLVHDDFSDGNLAPISPAVTLTEIIPNQTTQFAGDFRCNCYWGIETQGGTRDYTFGTTIGSEEIRGICLRFSGIDATTPILSGTPIREGGLAFVDLTATQAGQMFVEIMFRDANMIVRTPKTGWNERVDSQAGGASIYCATKPVTTEELTVRSPTPRHTGVSGFGYGFGFVLDQTGETARTVAGVTRDQAGDVLVSCQVSLFKHLGSGAYAYIATQVSDGTTGAYTFTVYDNPASYMVYAHKDDSPNVFDASSNNLTPT